MEYNLALVILLFAWLAPVSVLIAGAIRLRFVAPTAIASTAVVCGLVIASFWQDDVRFDASWAPAWDFRFTIELDGLARMYALLATGIGLLVVIYAAKYIPLHLHHQHRPRREELRFFVVLLVFMAAMTGLVMATNTVLLFVFWDITAIASFFLIGFDRDKEESRSAALMALLITGISAVCVLIGFLMLGDHYGTFNLHIPLEDSANTTVLGVATALIVVGALAKSAQFPLHFWLPNAMAAPTPVSAYLHSAAMVAAGVFLIGRMYPLIMRFNWLLDTLLVVGGASMVVGGVVALSRDVLKQVLAYSTISQYGYVVFLFGLGSEHGVSAATFYVLAHALAKSALFMTAGSVTEVTGSTSLTGVQQFRIRQPLLMYGSAAAAAGLIALPLTIGFFKDEFFFDAAWERGRLYGLLAVFGATLTFVYISRFWLRIFRPFQRNGDQLKVAPAAHPFLEWPIAVLGLLVVVDGIWLAPAQRIAEAAASIIALHKVDLHGAYHLDTSATNLMALATWVLGIAMISIERAWQPLARGLARIGDKVGPERGYQESLRYLNRFSDWLHETEVRDLRSRIATILVPAGALVGLAVYVTPNSNEFVVGPITRDDAPSVFMLLLTMFAAIALAWPRDHLSLALVVSCVGYSLSVVYAFLGAPNVALVAVLIETIFTLLFVGMLILMPVRILRYETRRMPERFRVRRDAVLAAVAGGMAFFVVWGALSQPADATYAIDSYVALAPVAHAKNVVTAILADFRGLDTAGEITVISIGLLGIVGLLKLERPR